MTKLYAFGSNGNGQLGLGHLEDTSTPEECTGIPTDILIKKISGGGNHSAVLTNNGHIYMAGSSQFGEEQMKTLLKESECLTYQRRFESIEWADVACGWAFTLLLSQSGRLYGIGTSRWNELAGSSTSTLVELDINLNNITSVACGWRHTVVLDVHGQVYGWGWGRHGQLGPAKTPPKDKKDIRFVQRIDMPQKIVQVACGHLHTLLRGQDGTVYMFGSNKYGQLDGHVEHAVWIDAGWHHSIALDEDGILHIWGRNDHGQLGEQYAKPLQSVVCGSEHTLALTPDNHALAWGWNEHGNCGSDKDFTSEAVVIDGLSSVDVIGAGCASSWLGVNV